MSDMSLKISSDPAPLATDDDGVVRISLPDIYATISYYLQHQTSVDAYLRERMLIHDETRKLNESRFDPAGIRDRLLRRKNQSPS